MLNVTYRKVPTVTLDTMVRDVGCSVRWALDQAEALRLDPKCLGTMGESAGSYLASMVTLAIREPMFSHGCDGGDELDPVLRWSVPYYGISDIDAFASAGGLGVLMPGLADQTGLSTEALSPTAYAGQDPAIGFFLAHGTEDDVVPSSQSQVYFDALAPAGHPVELRIMEGVPHGFVHGDAFYEDASLSIQDDIERFVREMNTLISGQRASRTQPPPCSPSSGTPRRSPPRRLPAPRWWRPDPPWASPASG